MSSPRRPLRALALALALAATTLCAVPTPTDHLGFAPGTDYKLANTQQIFSYFHKLAASSDRIRFVEFGKTTMGKPMYAAFLSAPENLKQLDRYRDLNRRMALGQASLDEARRIAADAKAVVWIDSGLHASEVAPAQHAPELAWRLVTGDTPEIEDIRRNVILIQIPVINPDGLDWIAEWYGKNVGTPYELAQLPWLYQRYSGHDNNRDYFMLNLVETRHVTRMLFREWFPQIVYNQHQVPPFPARIFIPPYAEPLNPNIPAPVMEGINLIGAAMKERFALEDKPGILSYHGFDGWWNGGLRSVPAFHNMHGILTETAGYVLGTPRTYRESDIRGRFTNGLPTREPSIFYQRPWMGGKWGMRDAIEYMLTADFGILNIAAQRRSEFLMKAWTLARAAIEAGEKQKPFAWIVAPDTWDRQTAVEMLDRLQQAGIDVRRASAAFSAGGRQYPAGAFVLPAAQPFRPYLYDLMEPQRYPEIRSGSTTAPVKRPYDITGWTLPMQMGVKVDRIDERFEAPLEPAAAFSPVGPGTVDPRDNASFLTIAQLLERGQTVRRASDGAILTGANDGKAAWELKAPRVGLYQPWIANADQGWTEWVFTRYRVPHTLVHNDDLRQGGLRARFDALVFAQQTSTSILNGVRHGETGGRYGSNVQRPEYTGGVGTEGLAAIAQFVREGGTLVAFDTASDLAIQFFPLSVRNVVRRDTSSSESFDAEETSSATFYAPGSLIRLTVDNTHPLALGMPKETIAMTSGGSAFDITLTKEHNQGEREIRSVARFASKDLLASGWVSGESVVLGRHALLEAKYGQGRVVLFGFRPQFRGQTFATFKLLLNAVYLAAARPL
jgi:hypothetical protein